MRPQLYRVTSKRQLLESQDMVLRLVRRFRFDELGRWIVVPSLKRTSSRSSRSRSRQPGLALWRVCGLFALAATHRPPQLTRFQLVIRYSLVNTIPEHHEIFDHIKSASMFFL